MQDEKELFKEYNLKYQLLPIEDLNQKILTDKTGFYYLIYVKSSTDKYISVVNSLTGEMIYSNYTPVAYNVKSKDIKKLQQKIEAN